MFRFNLKGITDSKQRKRVNDNIYKHGNGYYTMPVLIGLLSFSFIPFALCVYFECHCIVLRDVHCLQSCKNCFSTVFSHDNRELSVYLSNLAG